MAMGFKMNTTFAVRCPTPIFIKNMENTSIIKADGITHTKNEAIANGNPPNLYAMATSV